MILVTESNFHSGLVPVAECNFMIKIMLVELFLESIAKLLKTLLVIFYVYIRYLECETLSKIVKKFVYLLHQWPNPWVEPARMKVPTHQSQYFLSECLQAVLWSFGCD